jgi:predicted small lipoprotein YifL
MRRATSELHSRACTSPARSFPALSPPPRSHRSSPAAAGEVAARAACGRRGPVLPSCHFPPRAAPRPQAVAPSALEDSGTSPTLGRGGGACAPRPARFFYAPPRTSALLPRARSSPAAAGEVAARGACGRRGPVCTPPHTAQARRFTPSCHFPPRVAPRPRPRPLRPRGLGHLPHAARGGGSRAPLSARAFAALCPLLPRVSGGGVGVLADGGGLLLARAHRTASHAVVRFTPARHLHRHGGPRRRPCPHRPR